MSLKYEEPRRTHKLPSSDKRPSDYHFSNGQPYIHPQDRIFRKDYYDDFSERDKLLDAAIERGRNLHCDTNLWRIYDDAVMNYGLEPINPYEWLFNHATIGDKSIVISSPRQRLLIVRTLVHAEYYDFIHGKLKYFARYARPVE